MTITLIPACGIWNGSAFDLPVVGDDASASETAGPDVSQPVPDAGDASDAQLEADPLPTSPDQVPSLELWLRADQGLDAAVDGTISTWRDFSNANDPGRNAIAMPNSAPVLVPNNAQYASRPTVHFADGQLLQTGLFSKTIIQPASVLIVGHASSGAAGARYFLDSLTVAKPFSVYAAGTANTGVTTDSLQLNAGLDTNGATATVTKPSVIIVVFRGANSAVYVSAKTSVPLVTGSNAATGFTLGNWAGGSAFASKGDLAEVAVYSRALNASEVEQLEIYAGSLYKITIGP